MGWLANTLVGVALTVGLSIPDTISYVAPPPLTIEEKILKELPPVFLEIAKAESQMKPTAYNNEGHYDMKGNLVCRGSFSILQVSCLHYPDHEGNFDVDTNIQIAKELYEREGFDPWAVCVKKVKCYE